MMIANQANFRATEKHATAELIAELVIKTGATVDGNASWSFGLLHIFIITHYGDNFGDMV